MEPERLSLHLAFDQHNVWDSSVLRLTVVPTFVLLSGIPWAKYITLYSSVKNYLGCFQFWAGVIKVALNIHNLLVDIYVFVSLELLDQMVSVYFNCIKLPNCFKSVCFHLFPFWCFCWFVNNFCHSSKCEVLSLRFSFAFA